MLRYRLFGFLFVLTSLPLFFAPALAADHERLVGSFAFTPPSTCTDPILVEGSFDEVQHTYFDKSGNPVRLKFTGKVIVKYTNLTTGATYRPNSSGPGTVDLLTGQSVLRGGNGVLFDSNGVLIATDGRVVQDADGNIISVTGHIEGVCDQLGSSPV